MQTPGVAPLETMMIDPRLRPFRAMAHDSAWANHRLLSACSALSDEQFTLHRTGFFPSISATLNHILVVDWFYVDALEGGTLGADAWRDPEPFRNVRALRQAQAAVDRRLLAFVDALKADDLERVVAVHRPDTVQRERTDTLLLHLHMHQVHHRGQAHAMLSGTAVAPPQLDEFFCEMDADRRAPELRELGWHEGQWWSGPGRP